MHDCQPLLSSLSLQELTSTDDSAFLCRLDFEVLSQTKGSSLPRFLSSLRVASSSPDSVLVSVLLVGATLGHRSGCDHWGEEARSADQSGWLSGAVSGD